MLRVLFADDHLPDEGVQGPDIESHYRAVIQERFADETDGFRERAVRGYPVLRDALEHLRLDGYDVAPANTLAHTLKLASKEQFDVAIIDLGWFMQRELDYNLRQFGGWQIVDEIERSDAKTGHVTRKILYSSRLNERAELIPTAVKKGLLPLLKHTGVEDTQLTPEEVARENLRAAVRYLEKEIDQVPDAERELRHAILKSFQQWERISQAAPVVAIALWILAVVMAVLTQNVAVSAVPTVFALASTFFVFLGGQSKQARADTMSLLDRVTAGAATRRR